MNEINYQKWLRSLQSERCLLIALENSAETIYLSSAAYTSRPSDQLANIPFRECLINAPELSDTGTLEVGDLEFIWPERVVELRSRHWRGHIFTMWIGSVEWGFDDFRQIHTGYIDRVSRSGQHRLTVDFASTSLALQQPVSSTFENTRLPHTLGSVKNVTPVQLAENTNTYAVSDGRVDAVTIRVDGNTPRYNIDLEAGSINFRSEVQGTLTADVTVNTSSTFKAAVEALGIRRGIQFPVFDHFPEDLLSASVGYYINDDADYETVFDTLVESVGAFVTHDAVGVMHIVYLDNSRPADLLIRDDDIKRDSISEVGELRELSDITLNYAKNYTVQSELAHYSNEWKTLSKENSNNHYPEGWREPLVLETYFSDQSDASNALDRLSGWRFVRRIRYSMTLFLRGVSLRRGDRLGVESASWGLSVVGTVLSVERQPDSNRYDVEIIA